MLKCAIDMNYEANLHIYMLLNVIHVERCEISMIFEVYAIDVVIEICRMLSI